jgi:hypothetical protein
MIDIENSTKEELLKEWNKVQQLWNKYSCESLGFYYTALHRRIVQLGGWA